MQDHEKLQAEHSLASLTAQLASAYVSNNTISTADVGRLIAEVARQLRAVGEEQQAPAPGKLAPAVSVRRSIGRDHLVCLACGKKQRMLKRHLATEHDLTPDAYREMFSLKPDYPMVAPSYAEARRELAMKIGLGRPRTPTKKEAPAPTKEEVPAKTRRTRAKAA
jgi:predicted transcriptional regulator